VLGAYVSAWNCLDVERRAQILDGCWAPQATYTDPTVHLCGAAALAAHICGRLAARPGMAIEIVGEVRAHHGWATFAWRAQDGGAVLVSGIDCVEFGPDGRLERVVGFFD
jgi:plasmid replication initiation protein